MKRLKNKLNKGFTLIELMVVISIIALLSSVVLVALKDARDKAKANAFRASVNQFINALELYRADKGMYPGAKSGYANFGFIIKKNLDGSFVSYSIAPIPYFPDYDSYKTALNSYIKDFPKPIIPESYFMYRGDASPLGGGVKCFGDTSQKPYIILVSSSHTGFEDLPYAQNLGTVDTNYRCFSLK